MASLGNLAVPETAMIALRMLTRAADENLDCPSNGVLATAMGRESIASGASAVALLEAAGVITVQRFTAARVVTITSTGRSTRPVSGIPIKFRGKRREAWLPNDDEIASFADQLADGATVTAAARDIGLTEAQGRVIFKRMKADLGRQAA